MIHLYDDISIFNTADIKNENDYYILKIYGHNLTYVKNNNMWYYKHICGNVKDILNAMTLDFIVSDKNYKGLEKILESLTELN